MRVLFLLAFVGFLLAVPSHGGAVGGSERDESHYGFPPSWLPLDRITFPKGCAS